MFADDPGARSFEGYQLAPRENSDVEEDYFIESFSAIFPNNGILKRLPFIA